MGKAMVAKATKAATPAKSPAKAPAKNGRRLEYVLACLDSNIFALTLVPFSAAALGFGVGSSLVVLVSLQHCMRVPQFFSKVAVLNCLQNVHWVLRLDFLDLG